MAHITVNGIPALAGSLSLPRIGLWQALVSLDTQASLSGEVTVSWGTMELSGIVFSAVLTRGEIVCRIVGGAPLAWKTMAARGFKRPNAKTILSAISDASGVKLSGAISGALLSRELDFFAIMGGQTAGQAVECLAGKLGVAWRVLLDGTLWLGEEDWRSCAADASPELLEVVAMKGPAPCLECRLLDESAALPGETLDGCHIDRVEHLASADGLSASIWFDPEMTDEVPVFSIEAEA